jgi:hypothetical protein
MAFTDQSVDRQIPGRVIMNRIFTCIAALAVLSVAGSTQAQQIIYYGQPVYVVPSTPTYSYPTYTVNQPVQSSFVDDGTVPLYPIAAPLDSSTAVKTIPSTSPASQPDSSTSQAKTNVQIAAAKPVETKASAVSHRIINQSTPTQSQGVVTQRVISQPTIQYSPTYANPGAPQFFQPQNCFSGR